VDRDTRLEPQAAAGTEEAPSPDPAPQPRPDRRSVPALMSADPRLTVWIRRAVMALVVGVGLAIWVGWRWGLTGAALVAVLDTLYQSKAMAPVPAEARATSAQRKTRRRLAGLRTSGYVTLNARGIPDSDQQIDHLVVGPSGIYAIDSEQWDRRLPVRVAKAAKGDGVLYHGPFSQTERLKHARWEAGEAARLLSTQLGQPVTVRPAMVIYGPDINWGVASLRGVEVFAGNRVRKFFRAQNKATRGDQLDEEEISMISEAAEQVLPPAL
jgi:hypothetical protein